MGLNDKNSRVAVDTLGHGRWRRSKGRAMRNKERASFSFGTTSLKCLLLYYAFGATLSSSFLLHFQVSTQWASSIQDFRSPPKVPSADSFFGAALAASRVSVRATCRAGRLRCCRSFGTWWMIRMPRSGSGRVCPLRGSRGPSERLPRRHQPRAERTPEHEIGARCEGWRCGEVIEIDTWRR